MTSVSFDLNIDIACPPQVAYDLVTDIANIADHFAIFEEVVDYHGGTLSEGDRWQIKSTINGETAITTYMATELDPPMIMRWDQDSPGAKGGGIWHITPIEGGTNLHFVAGVTPKGEVSDEERQAFQQQLAQLFMADLERIKAKLER